MRQFNLHEAKTHLSRLVDEAAAGEDLVICKSGKPMVRLTALVGGETVGQPRPRLGLLQGQCAVPDDFDRLDADVIAHAFEGL